MKLLVVDDEPAARRAIALACREQPDVEVVGEAVSVASALPLIETLRPDAIILDVIMPGDSGFDLIRRTEAPPPVVIYTGHVEHALGAFEIEAFDFLLKPLSPPRFARVIERLRQAVAERRPAPDPTGGPLAVRLTGNRGHRFVPTDRILGVEADRDCCRLLLAGGETVVAAQSIGRIEDELSDPPFQRLGRSLIVNTGQIERIEPLDNGRGTIRFADGITTLEVGRAPLSVLRRQR